MNPVESEGSATPLRRLSRRLAVASAAILLLWVLAATVTAGLAYRDLDAARDSFDHAADKLLSDDLLSARHSLLEGVGLSASATERLEQGHLAPLGRIPGLGDNLTTATILSSAVRDTGAASARVLELGLGAIESDRDFELGPEALQEIQRLSPALHELADVLRQTRLELGTAPHKRLVGPVDRARREFLGIADEALGPAQLAADLTEILPSFLGASEPRTYLLGAASLSELRAAGGLIGSWSLLVAEEGRLRFDDFSSSGELKQIAGEATSPSADFTARYERFGALREWRNATLTPDFPTAARIMLEMWELQGGEPLDGVIVTDTVTFQRIVERSGPMEVPGVVTLTSENVLDFVGVEAYAAFGDQAERKEVLGAVATSAFERIVGMLDGEGLRSTLRMLDELAQGGHLRIYARDERTQHVLQRAGVGGEVPDIDGQYLGVFVSNFAANKVDFFSERRLEHRAVIRPGGRMHSSLEVHFANEAPREGYPRHVLGPWTELTDAGDNLSFVSVLCGYRCEFVRVPEGANDGGAELGRPVVDATVLIRAGERRRLSFHTTTPNAWHLEGDEIVATVRHHVQPTLRGSHLRIVLPLPDGWEPVGLPDDAVIVDRNLVFVDTTASGLVELVVRLAPVENEGDSSSS